MGNCCKKDPPPTVISVSGQDDLVDIEHERARQVALALNVGKGPVKIEGKLRFGFEKESFTKYKRHPPEEKSSLESIYKYVPSIPAGESTPLPMKRKFSIPKSNSR